MNKEDYFKYYIQGSEHYLIPKDVFNELFDEMENWREEAKELKKQLEECYCNRTDCSGRIKDSKTYDSLEQKIKNQQKEFTLYLENEIYSIEPKGTGINYNCEYDSEEDYISAMKEQSKLNTLKEILSKYKEIIGNDINVGSKGVKDELFY